MPIRLPEPRWPSELTEEGPPEDPSILLGGAAEIGERAVSNSGRSAQSTHSGGRLPG